MLLYHNYRQLYLVKRQNLIAFDNPISHHLLPSLGGQRSFWNPHLGTSLGKGKNFVSETIVGCWNQQFMNEIIIIIIITQWIKDIYEFCIKYLHVRMYNS